MEEVARELMFFENHRKPSSRGYALGCLGDRRLRLLGPHPRHTAFPVTGTAVPQTQGHTDPGDGRSTERKASLQVRSSWEQLARPQLQRQEQKGWSRAEQPSPACGPLLCPATPRLCSAFLRLAIQLKTLHVSGSLSSEMAALPDKPSTWCCSFQLHPFLNLHVMALERRGHP